MHLIRVGNSLGVRIPKAIIAQVGFLEDSDLVCKVTDEGLLISPSCQEKWLYCFGPDPHS
jgi:antitoxin component of MazEF toxin-antitoxin module